MDPTNGSPVICASYERVSTMLQARHGYSLTAQESGFDDFIARQPGWTLPADYRMRDGEEQNASGADWDLPGLTKMLGLARNGAFSVLLVPDLDRFARTMVKGLVLEEQLRKYGVRVVFLSVPVEDTPEGRMQKNTLYTFAEYEREKFRMRTMLGKVTKARLGEVGSGGFPPYGYRFKKRAARAGHLVAFGLEADPVTEPIARRILDQLRFRAAKAIVDDLNAEGVPTPRGRGLWRVQTVTRMGRDRVYTGEWVYGRNAGNGGIVVAVPALIERQAFDEIGKALTERSTRRSARRTTTTDPYLLRGLLTCGRCGSTLHAVLSSGKRYYVCGAQAMARKQRQGDAAPCRLPMVPAPALEAEAWAMLEATFLDEARFEAALARHQDEHADANRMRVDRAAALATRRTAEAKRLGNVLAGMADAGSETIRAILLEQAGAIERAITTIDAEAAGLAAAPGPGLTAADRDTIRDLRARIAATLDTIDDTVRRQMYERLRLRGTVIDDADGLKLGRLNRFAIDWTWQGGAPLTVSGQSALTCVLLSRSTSGLAHPLEILTPRAA